MEVRSKNQLDEFYDRTVELVERYAQCAVKDPSCDIEEAWDIISPNLMFICDEAEKSNLRNEAYQNLVKSLDEKPEGYRTVTIDEVLDRLKDDVENGCENLELGDNNGSYSKIKEMLTTPALSHPLDESDITAVSQNVNLIDPLTKLRLTDPVKNIKCGHVYERETIFKLLSQRSIKCPIAGCVAAPQVLPTDLVSDVALRRYLKQNP